MQRTLVLIKPDGVQRALIGEVIKRLEQRGLRLVAAKFVKVNQDLAEKHYAIHRGKNFFDPLISYITSSPVMAMVWDGPNAISATRQTMGKTNPLEAESGSIRHDFGLVIGRNITHASDSEENAEKEISLWFHTDEIIDWKRESDRWIYE